MPDRSPEAELSARARVINGLRKAVNYLEQHPGVPVSEHGWTLLSFPDRDSDDAGHAAVDAILGVPARDDTPSGGHYRAAKSFGPVTYEFVHVSSGSRGAYQAVMSYSGAVAPASLPDAA